MRAGCRKQDEHFRPLTTMLTPAPFPQLIFAAPAHHVRGPDTWYPTTRVRTTCHFCDFITDARARTNENTTFTSHHEHLRSTPSPAPKKHPPEPSPAQAAQSLARIPSKHETARSLQPRRHRVPGLFERGCRHDWPACAANLVQNGNHV